jgi:hypothetical protein
MQYAKRFKAEHETRERIDRSDEASSPGKNIGKSWDGAQLKIRDLRFDIERFVRGETVDGSSLL